MSNRCPSPARALCLTVALSACTPASLDRLDATPTEPALAQTDAGLCYAKGTSRGSAAEVAAGRPQPSRTIWFETPCALEAGDPDFVADIQRALQVRGLYDGPITGRYDAATRAAVLRLQDPLGLASSTLSTETARSLGLVAIPRE